MRHFQHLTNAQIHEIIAAYTGGEETQAELARRFGVDHSTIHYHIQKYERAYPEEGGIYATLKVSVRKVCVHPSGRCTICGDMWDELRREERALIASLQKQLSEAQSKLRVAGLLVE